MKARDVREIAVGALTLAGLAVVLGMSYGGTTTEGVGDGYRVNATFNRIDGLRVGDDVQVGGIKVGVVEKAWLNDDFCASVAMRMTPGVELPTDTAAAIHTDGLFGSKFVVLDPGGELELLNDGSTITFTQDAVIVGELLELIIAQGRAQRGLEGKGGQ